MINIYDILTKRTGHLLKIALLDTQGQISYTKLLGAIEKRSNQIKKFNLKNQSLIAIYTGRGIQYWIDLLAIWSCNCIAIPLNHSSAKNKLDNIIEQTQPRLIILNNQIQDTKSNSNYYNLPYNTAIINFSSGTTGDPKGIPLTHEALYENLKATSHALRGFTSSDKLFINIGFQFISALSHFLVTLYKGASILSCESSYSGADLVELINKFKISAFGGSPCQASWILEHGDKLINRLNWIMSSGDFLSPTTINNFLKKMSTTKIYCAYGMTELSGRFCILEPTQLPSLIGSVGKPISCLKLKIIDEKNNELNSFEIGNVLVKGSSLFCGYLNQPQLDQNNWFNTGDIGYLDHNGNLFLKGRSDNVIKLSGHKISTFEIDNFLLDLRIFSDIVTLVMQPDSDQKKLVTFYTLKQNFKFNRPEISRSIRTQLSSLHIPAYFIEIKNIPRTKSGKAIRKELEKIALTQIENTTPR